MPENPQGTHDPVPEHPPNSGEETELLLRRAQQGDSDAKGELWKRYYRFMCFMVRVWKTGAPLTGGDTTSDEVANAAMRLLSPGALAKIHNREHFRNWLRTLFFHRAVDRHRSSRRPSVALPDEPVDDRDEATPPSDFVLDEMRRCLETLPLGLLHIAKTFLDAGNERDAATRLGITRHALRTRLAEIKDIWTQHNGEN